MKLNLLTKILLWVFVNLLVLTVVLYFILNLQFRFAPHSPLLGAADERIEMISMLISSETAEKTRVERDEILKKFSDKYKIEFTIFANNGMQLAGVPLKLPEEILDALDTPLRKPPGVPAGERIPPPPPPGQQVRIERTSSPPGYWAIARIPVFEKNQAAPIRASVVARSDSFTGNGLFFKPMPWIVTILAILGLSALVWFPFVRSLNKSVSQLTTATEQIASENFDVKVDETRRDELGRLGKSVNHLASRLSGFVNGQKRFLGDISHELNSPLARMNWALGILETRVREADQKYIEDVKEEVELMAKLVEELLSYSKAGIKGAEISLEKVNLRQTVDEVIGREKAYENSIKLDVESDISVLANKDLLARAISNVVRNAIRYSDKSGGISIKAEIRKGNVFLKTADSGNGVPDSEIERLFDPLYRLEKDRARKSGGTGLGLAIVKACIEACDGKVTARNLKPKGFEIEFMLNPFDAN